MYVLLTVSELRYQPGESSYSDVEIEEGEKVEVARIRGQGKVISEF